GQDLPSGAVGEIVVTSRYIPCGYFGNRSQSRSEKGADPIWQEQNPDDCELPPKGQTPFRKDSHSETAHRLTATGETEYHTGDLGVKQPDGCLIHLGRKDSQLKINGRRVDPSEIEKVLLDLSSIREAAVVAHPDHEGNAKLVAYVVADSGSAPVVSELREALALILPNYLIPSVFVMLDSMPKTISNKIDRKALLAPDLSCRQTTDHVVVPRTDIERWLASVWCEVLNKEMIGANDDFFELGGDSLQAMRVISRVSDALEDKIHLAVLFDAPVLSEMAEALAKAYTESSENVPLFKNQSIRSSSIVETLNPSQSPCQSFIHRKVDENDVACVQERVDRFFGAFEYERLDSTPDSVCRPAALIVTSSRSGSTLLRDMLAGHSRLFVPPELALLMFSTMAERRRVFSGPQAFRRESVIHALMAATECEFVAADRLLTEWELRGDSISAFYRMLQDHIGPRLLVDKTPSYSLSGHVLNRAESTFENPRYIHLVRHPGAAIESYDKARMAESSLVRRPESLSPQQFAECLWLISHRNILEHLSRVPGDRQLRVCYEDLVRDPRSEAHRICEFMGVGFEEAVLQPYDDERVRMADDISPRQRMIGDPNFHRHRDSSTVSIDRWREVIKESDLSDATWELASQFGYWRQSKSQYQRVA
ncbi:MAG: AMP-binding protein, partial [Planctomycetes bacterium]|nr:AMP-binding protein [Planctomycetota bacterium]